jgi:hypothetical protein
VSISKQAALTVVDLSASLDHDSTGRKEECMIASVIDGSIVDTKANVILIGVGTTPSPHGKAGPLVAAIEREFWPGLSTEEFVLGEIKKYKHRKKLIVAVCCHNYKISSWKEVTSFLTNALHSIPGDLTIASVVIGCASVGGNQTEQEQSRVLDVFSQAMQPITVYYNRHQPYAFDHPRYSHWLDT